MSNQSMLVNYDSLKMDAEGMSINSSEWLDEFSLATLFNGVLRIHNLDSEKGSSIE